MIVTLITHIILPGDSRFSGSRGRDPRRDDAGVLMLAAGDRGSLGGLVGGSDIARFTFCLEGSRERGCEIVNKFKPGLIIVA